MLNITSYEEELNAIYKSLRNATDKKEADYFRNLYWTAVKELWANDLVYFEESGRLKVYPKDCPKQKALCYAEKYGICEYKVTGNEMIYYKSYRMEHSTIKAVVNLDTMTETRSYMRRYYRPWVHIGKVQVNG